MSGRPAGKEVEDPKPVYKYELKPEHGEFMVFVKTFPGEYAGDARVKQSAEGLAEYIRAECRLNAYVFERGWQKRQERKKELEAVMAAMKQYYEVDRKMPIPEAEISAPKMRSPMSVAAPRAYSAASVLKKLRSSLISAWCPIPQLFEYVLML